MSDLANKDIRSCIKNLERIERSCRRDGSINKAAILRKAISQLKMAQRAE